MFTPNYGFFTRECALAPLDEESDVNGDIPNHNAFLRKTIQDCAAQQGWQLDLSDLARDATPIANRMIERHGKAFSGTRASHLVDGKCEGRLALVG